MPIYDVLCGECGQVSEVLVMNDRAPMTCPNCGSEKTEKQMSAPSTLTGRTGRDLPGPGDHGCCGSRPSEAGCAGPGSCCGKTF